MSDDASIVATLGAPGKRLPEDRIEPEEPAYDPKEIYGILPSDVRQSYDVHEVIARLVDGSGCGRPAAGEVGRTGAAGAARRQGRALGRGRRRQGP